MASNDMTSQALLCEPVRSETVSSSIRDVSEQVRLQGIACRFPCRARGVPDCHNARTAYIDIPRNAVHGTQLMCSHAVCRTSGRQFRFCAVCQIPVAKRNFSKRHSHGLLEVPPEKIHHDRDDADTGSSGSGGKRLRLNSVGDAIRILQESEVPVTLTQEETTDVPRVVIATTPTANPDADTFSTTNAEACSTVAMELTEQERKWLELFHNRPTSLEDEGEFRTWMDAIIETADFKAMDDSLNDAEYDAGNDARDCDEYDAGNEAGDDAIEEEDGEDTPYHRNSLSLSVGDLQDFFMASLDNGL